MPTKSDVIKDVYTTYYGTKAETLAHIKDDPDYAEYKITKKDVEEWFATSHLTEGSKKAIENQIRLVRTNRTTSRHPS